MKYELVFSSTFTKSVKRLSKDTNFLMDLNSTLYLLKDDPFNVKLRTHKLKGKLEGLFACKVDYNRRIVFSIINNISEHHLLLIDIGSHDEVY